MATKKDLVEAHAFSRRRLVTAFVSGAPGGREVEPVRPGRILIGGIALSVLLLAGAAVAGFLIGRPPAAWLETGSFVISKDTGEQYVVLIGGDDPVLQRVPNYVSAQLLLGKSELSPFTVRDKYIRTVRLGDDLGIEGAPAGLPDAEELVNDGWTACTQEDAGIKVVVQDGEAAQEVANSAFMVSSGNRLWLIATAPPYGTQATRAYRYEMPADEALAGTIANKLGFGSTSDAPRVDNSWLNLFPLGSPLTVEEFGVTKDGQPVTYTAPNSTDLREHTIGDLLVDGNGTFYLLGDEAPEVLSPFAGMVYDAVGRRAKPVDDVRWGFPPEHYPQDWPAELPSRTAGGAMCAVLHPVEGEISTVGLASTPAPEADPTDLAFGRHDVDVAPSGGAYVLSAGDDSGAGGSPYVIDTKGLKYALVGPEVPVYIGYGEVAPLSVPSSWLKFFDTGVPLSTNAARRVPADAPAAADPEGAEES